MLNIFFNNRLKISAKGLNDIKNHEGWRPYVYLDAVGLPTIGYGHLIKPGERFTTITKEQGEKLLLTDVARFEARVNKIVKVKLTQRQFDVLVSFLFNLGEHALNGTTSLKLLNSGNYKAFADRLLLWNKGVVKGVLVPIYGLTLRRQIDRKIFLGMLP
jgi:lysozyme